MRTTSTTKRPLLRSAVALGCCLLLGSCAGDSAEPSGASPSAKRPTPAVASPKTAIGGKLRVAGVTANYHGFKNVAGARSVSIEVEDNYFAPTVIKGKPGQRLVVVVENESQSPHTFTVAGRYIDLELEPGKIAEVRITLPRSGNLSFYCAYQKKNGMAGGFNVSGPFERPGPKPTTSPR